MTFVQQGDRLVGSAISLLWMVVHSVQVKKIIVYAVIQIIKKITLFWFAGNWPEGPQANSAERAGPKF